MGCKPKSGTGVRQTAMVCPTPKFSAPDYARTLCISEVRLMVTRPGVSRLSQPPSNHRNL